ncbi:MAG TPA: hypothetical protein VGB52_04280 [Actinomycetota bacterium]
MKRAVVALVLLLAACGGSDLRAVTQVRVQVEVRADDQGPLETGLVICDGRQARGTGLYADEVSAVRACDAIRSNLAVQRLLFSGPDPDRACPEIYGGPQRAKVAGVVDGQEVDVRIDRTNGCGIDDWNALEPLIGPPLEPATPAYDG